MTFDAAYLGRSLDNRLPDVHEAVTRDVRALQNTHAAAGRLQSGATLIAFEEIATNLLKSSIADASKFIFESTGGHEPEAVAYLKNFADRVQQIITTEISEKADRLGLGAVTVNHLIKVRGKLDRFSEQAIDDFSHGMQGNERLKKDPIVSVVQSHSPGAIQQVGVGQVSQSAIIDNRQALVQAIDQALASDNFSTLSPEQKTAFADLADALKDEANKNKPDPGKLKRWGGRLLSFSADVGMKMSTGVIAQVLVKMLGG